MRGRAGMAVAAVLLCGPPLWGCSDRAPAAGDRVIDTKADDAALNAAMKQAVDTLDRFWARFDAKPPGVSNFSVKLGITGEDGFKEFIWAEPIRRTHDEVFATLLNEPEHLGSLHYGSQVHVSKDLIYDWTYEKGGKAYGHFSTRVLIPKMTSEERAQVEGLLSPTPLEPGS
jgi:uncharacterized protein YegJ (DUF2314 family)